MATEVKKQVCCICGKEITGYGNNPWPVDKNPNAVCCDECNFNVVIPKRIEQMKGKRNVL